MAPLTDYERRRLENIKKNQSLLSSLAIQPVAPSKKSTRASQSATSTPSKKRARPPSTYDSLPRKLYATRSSARLSGVALGQVTPGLDGNMKAEPDEEPKVGAQDRHLDRTLVAESWRLKEDRGSDELTSGLCKCISSTAYPEKTKTMKHEEVNIDYLPGSDESYDQLTAQLGKMQLRACNKVCATRIYSVTFHPDPHKSLLFAGDKAGGVGIWDALASHTKSEDDQDIKSASSTVTAEAQLAKPDPIKPTELDEGFGEDEEENIAEGQAYFFQAHARWSAVSAIKTHPTQPHTIYTSSYDCSVREINFEIQQSSEIIDSESLSPTEDVLLSAFELANEGREIWCSDNAGGLIHRDLRQPKDSTRRWTISKKKIGCVSLCPNADDRVAVTAGLNREMRIWDLKALAGLSPDSDLAAVQSGACVATYNHRLACSSAYFDHSGSKLLSTSYDDLLRVWELDSGPSDWLSVGNGEKEFNPSYEARHDNQTGRWVTVMKARWCPNPLFPSHFTVGNMRHKVDVYSSKGELLTQLQHHTLSTVPAATCQHPTSSNNQIVGGTASGKVYLWK